MDRVPPVAQEVALLRGRSDQPVEAGFVEDRAEGVDPRAAVAPNRREIAQPDRELVEERPALRRELRSGLLELSPTRHGLPPRYLANPNVARAGQLGQVPGDSLGSETAPKAGGVTARWISRRFSTRSRIA